MLDSDGPETVLACTALQSLESTLDFHWKHLQHTTSGVSFGVGKYDVSHARCA